MAREQLIAWLNDAYAMEQGFIPILEKHAADAERETPSAASRIRRHIDETRYHARRVEHCLRHLGTSPSHVKSAVASVMGTVQGARTGMFKDGPVKDALSDVAAEQIAVACYRALTAAANELHEPIVAGLCLQNLREDEEMARWLDQQLAGAVRQALTTSSDRAMR